MSEVPPPPGFPPSDPATPSVEVPRPTWTWWEALIVGIVGFFAGGVLGTIAAIPIDTKRLQVLVIALASDIGLAAAVLAWINVRHRGALAALMVNLRKPVDLLKGVGWGVAIILTTTLVLFPLLSWLLQEVTHHKTRTPRQLPAHIHGPEIILTAILVAVAAPIAEELFFRGLLFRGFRARYGFLVSALASSLFFGLVHYQPAAWQNWVLLCTLLAFVGFALAWVYERSRNLLTNIAAHATFNIFGLIVIFAVVR
jgi:membrane protease YdiL (CAAX protease family)